MNARNPPEPGWFVGVEPGDVEAAARGIRDGHATESSDWPGRALESGFAEDEEEYYELLHGATIRAARAEVARRESADDRQLAHAIRALDDIGRILL